MIENSYILFTRIPLTKTGSGRIYCDPLWEKDLKIHLEYIDNFSICCPIEYSEDTNKKKDITDLGIKCFFPLKPDHGIASAIKNFFPNLLSVTRACKKAEIVHSGGAGWSFPLSFYLYFLKPFYSFKWIMLIESSFWMLTSTDKKTPRKLISNFIYKTLLARCIKTANARIFTQSFYRNYFLGSETDRTLINAASWIDDKSILPAQAVKERYNTKTDRKLRIIFPSRLTADKGIFVVLDAIRKLDVLKNEVHITLIGEGILEQDCRNFVNEYHGNADVSFQDPVAYGEPFFSALSKYDFVLVPTINQEQPRIVFDAFSQGVPVIGSDTSGIRDITNDSNAIFFKCGDSSSLAKTIASLIPNHRRSLEMGLAGLEYATGKTHRQMHRDREQFLIDVL